MYVRTASAGLEKSLQYETNKTTEMQREEEEQLSRKRMVKNTNNKCKTKLNNLRMK